MNVKLYKDRNWLESKYSKDNLSQREVARICKVKEDSAVNYWMKKFRIPIRSHSESSHLANANHCNLSSEALEWINGELLGDGCVHAYNKYSALIVYSSKFPKYIKYVSNTLKSFGIKQAGKIHKQRDKKWNCFYYCYNSLCYEELLLLRQKWYPNNKKIVPRDIKLTPLLCRQWYIGDSHLEHPKDSRPNIVISTCGFPIPDVEFLKEKLINLGFKTTRYPNNNSIHISVHSTKEFLNYIGPCPVKDYQYKWDYYKKEKEVNTEIKVLPQG